MCADRTSQSEALLENLRRAENSAELERLGIQPQGLSDDTLLKQFMVKVTALPKAERDAVYTTLSENGTLDLNQAAAVDTMVEPTQLTDRDLRHIQIEASDIWSKYAERITGRANVGNGYVTNAYAALGRDDLPAAEKEVSDANKAAGEIRHAWRAGVKNASAELKDRLNERFEQTVWTEDMRSVYDDMRADVFTPPQEVIDFTRSLTGLEQDFALKRDRAEIQQHAPEVSQVPGASPKPR